MPQIKVGVIPAAGRGTRMGYLSQILPKCLFPIYDRPIIHAIIENMKTIGVEQTYVIVNYQKEKLMEYLDGVRDELGVNIDYIEQAELAGIARAIMLARDYAREPFVVILGDDCTITRSLGNLADLFFKKDATVVEGIVIEGNPALLMSTCCVSLDGDGRIQEIVEKPRHPTSRLRGCGVYIFRPDIFSYIEKTPVSPIRHEVEITHTIDMLARENKAFGGFIDGVNININSYEDLLRASALARELKSGESLNVFATTGKALLAGDPPFPRRKTLSRIPVLRSGHWGQSSPTARG
jgi:dTDP-glucose pyrophosphorylase